MVCLQDKCFALGFIRYEVETAHKYDHATSKWVTTGEPGYPAGTKFDLLGDVIQETSVFEGDYASCCEACAGLRPPSAPPDPPAPPTPPPRPGYPPAPPPTPWAPMPPMGPAGSQLQDNYPNPTYSFPQPKGAAASAGTSPTSPPSPGLPGAYECHGIVFKRDALTGNTRCYLKTTEHLTIYNPSDVPALVHPRIAGDLVFAYSAPPPPPLEPQGAACQEYYPTAYAELGEPGVMDPEMGMSVIATDFLSKCRAQSTIPCTRTFLAIANHVPSLTLPLACCFAQLHGNAARGVGSERAAADS